MTNRLRSLASRVITSWASASAAPPRAPGAADRSTNGITAMEARRAQRRRRRRGRRLLAAVRSGAAAAAGGPAPCALAERHASRSGALSRPSASNSRAVAARCSSPSRIRPRRASAVRRISWTCRSNGASWSHLLQVAERLVVGNAPDEMLQQGGVAAAESPPLRGEPAVEDRAAVDLQALQKVAVEQRGQRSLPLRRERLDARLGRAGDLDRVDEAIRQVEPDGVLAGVDAPAASRSSTRPRILLRHQRSSPRGSLGTSHSSSQSWLLATARGARAR